MRMDMTPNICYNIITELVHNMFTQYNKENGYWEIYKWGYAGNKMKAYRIAAEKTEEAAIRKMHELYNERG